jgi:hypothetical protein
VIFGLFVQFKTIKQWYLHSYMVYNQCVTVILIFRGVMPYLRLSRVFPFVCAVGSHSARTRQRLQWWVLGATTLLRACRTVLPKAEGSSVVDFTFPH